MQDARASRVAPGSADAARVAVNGNAEPVAGDAFVQAHLPFASDSPGNGMSVDVEDYFQVSAFDEHIQRAEWDRHAPRVERNTDIILELFDKHGVKSTFFTLGWIAERFPALVRRIADNGHELASHGWGHVRAFSQTPAEFREDVSRTRKILEDTAGVAVTGYRAASYSIDQRNLWALDEFAAAGYLLQFEYLPDCPRSLRHA